MLWLLSLSRSSQTSKEMYYYYSTCIFRQLVLRGSRKHVTLNQTSAEMEAQGILVRILKVPTVGTVQCKEPPKEYKIPSLGIF